MVNVSYTEHSNTKPRTTTALGTGGASRVAAILPQRSSSKLSLSPQ